MTYLEDKLFFCRDRTCADVVAGVVTKCLNARPKTKDGGIAVCLMFVEIEQQAVVQVWLLTALSFACMPMRVSVSELMQRILKKISQGGKTNHRDSLGEEGGKLKLCVIACIFKIWKF